MLEENLDDYSRSSTSTCKRRMTVRHGHSFAQTFPDDR